MRRPQIGILTVLILVLITLSCREPSLDLNTDTANQFIRSFSFESSRNPSLEMDVSAQINGSTIYFNLPSGVDAANLKPSFEFNGKGLQVDGLWQESGSTVQNFSTPVFYDLVKSDNSRIQYTVLSGQIESGGDPWFFISFQAALNANLHSTIEGIVNDSEITFNFPFESNVQSMIPSFGTSSSAVVSYNGVMLNSDAAPSINPAGGGTLRVDFDDGSTKVYSFKVNIEKQKFIHVSTTGNSGASGSQSDPLNSIEEAVSLADSKGIKEIRLAIGSYTISNNLLIQNNLSIKGGYDINDWSYQNHYNPDIRSALLCEIFIAGGASGTPANHQGTITYQGSAVGHNTVLEGVRVNAMAGGRNFTSAVTVVDGASPTIKYSDLFGAATNDGSALSVYDASPRIYSSQILADASGYSIGLNVGYNAEPTVISSLISAYNSAAPNTGVALLLDGGNPGGWYYNNFIDGQGTSQGVAVKLTEAGGSFINNIFSVVPSSPADICFWEEGPGRTPDLLQSNNFSLPEWSGTLYMKDGSEVLDKAKDINTHVNAGSSDNSDYHIFNYSTYLSDNFSQTIPLTIAYEGQALSVLWPYDLYGNIHSVFDDNSWSRGPLECDYTLLGEKYLNISDMATDIYDGSWSALSLREALLLCERQDMSDVIIYPAGAPALILTESLFIKSSVYITSPDSSLIIDGADAFRHLIIDDGDSSTQSSVFIKGVTFFNGNTPVEGGAIFNLENLYLYDCHFDDNTAQRGGAVYTRNGLLYIANSVFTLNSASEEHGGALYVLDSVFNGHNLVFTLNITTGIAFSVGSCLYSENSLATISFSTIFDNEAMYEAAVYGKNSDLRIFSSIFNSNTNTVAGPPDETDVFIDGGSLDLKGSIVETPAYNNPPEVRVLAPGFLNTGNLDGADNIWKTGDDGLQALDNAQPMVNQGYVDGIPPDWADADEDGNTSEPFPYDITKQPRISGPAPDAGAYESF